MHCSELRNWNGKTNSFGRNSKYIKTAIPAGGKHDEAWMTSYRDFAVKYEGGMTIMEIVAQGEISRRTAYRYKAYYDEVQKNNRYKKRNEQPLQR